MSFGYHEDRMVRTDIPEVDNLAAEGHRILAVGVVHHILEAVDLRIPAAAEVGHNSVVPDIRRHRAALLHGSPAPGRRTSSISRIELPLSPFHQGRSVAFLK